MTVASDAAAEALRAADEAAVRVRPVATPDELDQLRTAMDAIWGPEVVPPRNLLRGMAIGGAGLLLATRGEEPVGFALGWLGWTGGPHFHSHQVGVTGAARGGGVGYALKLAQRAECLAHGITEMRWTFDPLLRRNARFNLVRLGTHVVAFLPHCYGERRDEFNTGDTTDRVEVSWRLDEPVGGHLAAIGPNDRFVPIPDDYHGLRATSPDDAAAARRRVGSELARVIGSGAVIGLGEVDGTTGYVSTGEEERS